MDLELDADRNVFARDPASGKTDGDAGVLLGGLGKVDEFDVAGVHHFCRADGLVLVVASVGVVAEVTAVTEQVGFGFGLALAQKMFLQAFQRMRLGVEITVVGVGQPLVVGRGVVGGHSLVVVGHSRVVRQPLVMWFGFLVKLVQEMPEKPRFGLSFGETRKIAASNSLDLAPLHRNTLAAVAGSQGDIADRFAVFVQMSLRNAFRFGLGVANIPA